MFLSCMAFAVYKVFRVVNKPNTQITSDANDYVTAKSHACKKETSARMPLQR